MANIIEIRDLSFAYLKEEVRALDHINLNIEEGAFLVLLGSVSWVSYNLSHGTAPNSIQGLQIPPFPLDCVPAAA